MTTLAGWARTQLTPGLPLPGAAAAVSDPDELHRRLQAAESRAAHLETALASNRRIGMAIGILMARHRLTDDQAFDLLRRHSNRRNVKLAAVAEEVVYTGELGPIPAETRPGRDDLGLPPGQPVSAVHDTRGAVVSGG